MSESSTPPPPTTPPARRWGLRLLGGFLAIVACFGGGGYLAYQQPFLRPYLQPHWHQFLAQIPFVSPPPPNTTPKTTRQSPPIAETTPAVSDDNPPPKTAAPTTTIAPATTARNTETPPTNRNLVNVREQIADLRDTIARLQLQQNTQNRRITELAQSPDAAIQLELIDLRLRQSGDTQTAANSLLTLQNNPAASPLWLADEIARLQNAPSRTQIVLILQKLLPGVPNASSSAAPDNSPADFMIKLFNIRHTAAPDAARYQQHLQRMELLFLTGQRTAYLSALDTFANRFAHIAEPNIALNIKLLQKFGAPLYALNYGNTP